MFVRLTRHDGARLLLNVGTILDVVEKPKAPEMTIVRTSLVDEKGSINYTVEHTLSQVQEMLIASYRQPVSTLNRSESEAA